MLVSQQLKVLSYTLSVATSTACVSLILSNSSALVKTSRAVAAKHFASTRVISCALGSTGKLKHMILHAY